MDINRFLSEFRHILWATGGLDRLRELVLQLAVSGRLVSPDTDTNDEAVESELAHAEFLKIQFEADFKLRYTKPYSPLSESKYPYEIPNHWCWKRLEQIARYIQRGKQPSYVNTGTTRVVSQKCVQWGGLDLSLARYVDDASLSSYSKERFLQPGDLLWNSTGTGTVGRASIYSGEGSLKAVTDSHITVIRANNFIPRYVWCFLASPWVQARISPEHKSSIVTGTTKQVELATSAVRALVIPCPPIAEQKRIVDKVDELIGLCDKLEVQQKQRGELSKLVRISTLQTLSNAGNLSDLQTAWSRVSQNINLLLDSEQGCIDFQSCLKKLAVRGLLSDWTDDIPPLDEIKEQCAVLKQEYIRKNWLRRRNPIVSKKHENDTYPPHWVVVPLDEVAIVIGGVAKGHRLKSQTVGSFPYLRVANVQRGFFDLTEIKQIEVPLHQSEKYYVEHGDLLITEGGDWDKVGRTAIWNVDISNCLHQNHVFKVRVPSSLLLNEWVELVLNSYVGRDYFAGASKQTTNLASINMTQLRSFPLPIPPISEQIAILEKIKSLLSMCQRLEHQHIELSDIARSLTTAMVTSITGIQIEDKKKMKVPKTELISTLRIGVSPANSERAPLAAILIRNNGEMPTKSLWNASGLQKIDVFYQQLKTEMAKGWIVQPEVAYVREVEVS